MKDRDFFQIMSSVFLFLMLLLTSQPAFGESKQTFSLEELAHYNGQNGKPAYVAVKGVVYDVTHVRGWANGRHFCQNAIAGKDLTPFWSMVPRSHQNPSFLKEFPVVGRLEAVKPGKSSPPGSKKVRFFTVKELTQFTGKNGQPAYVGVKGIVYDVTHIPEWVGGKHYCRNAIAGKDLTPLWKLAPPSHQSPGFLKAFPVVGKMSITKAKSTALAPKGPTVSMIVLAGLFIAFMITGAWLFFNLLLRR